MWGFHDGMGWWMVFGGVWSLALLMAVVWLVVYSMSRLAGGPSTTPPREDALEIARRRLAIGEISREEFEELRKVLQ